MWKRLFILFAILLNILPLGEAWCGSASAQTKWNKAYQDYIDKYKEVAIAEMLRYNIPASITLAQGVLESGAGRSALATKANNHFGIKCHDWLGDTFYQDDDEEQECFRAYNSVLDSYEDHSKFLTSKQRYASLFNLPHTDYKGWAKGLKAAGYATNPRYAQLLIGVIETYNLSKYDYATSVEARDWDSKYSKWSKLENEDKTLDIRICNKCYYIIARKGDTFESLSDETGISKRKLAKYNEKDWHDEVQKGDIIYLQKKKKHASKVFRTTPYIVKSGDTMYNISQRYAIRLKYLYKLNDLDDDYVLKVGDELWLY